MLRTILCCVFIAATSAMATQRYQWQELDGTPEDCGQGAHITYGANSIWGVFPDDYGATWVAHYDPLPTNGDTPDGGWTELDDPVPWGDVSHHTGVTFKWTGGNALYVIGDDGNGQTKLDWYSTDVQMWFDYYISEFSLGDGACIVYAPNPDYGQGGDLVPGWVYCLPGDPNDKTQFWRYAVEPIGLYQTVQGIFPPNGSTIADQTPMFQWTGGAGQYRLQVSTDDLFSTTVIDEVVYVPQFQTPSKLASATYYWRTGTPNGLNWTWGATHNFVLQGGFERISGHDIPEAIADGAAMAYEGDPWCWNQQSIIAVVGGGSTNFYKYNIAGNGWTPTGWLDDTPKPQLAGTSLTTNDPTEEYGQWPAAAFGGSTTSDYPWGYDISQGQTGEWFEYPSDDFYPFPQPLGAGACFVDGPRPWSYLTTGEQDGNATDYFYAIEPKHIKHPHGGGSQSGDAHTGSIQARVITSCDGTEVEYQLPAVAHVRATLYDAVGRQVDMLDAGSQQPGTHRLRWNRDQEGRRLSAGTYFVMLDMGKEQVRLKSIVR